MTAKTHDEGFAIRFGQCEWTVPTTVRVESSVPPISDTQASIAAALESPIGLPSLDQIIVSGDTVVLAVDPALPDLAATTVSVAQWLHEKGTEPKNLKIVLASNSPQLQSEVLERLTEGQLAEVEVQLHDPDDPQMIAYVAANEESDPIYVNRTLVDADVVIPLSCIRHSAAMDYLGSYSIFPLLSNRETRGKFYSLSRLDNPDEHAKLKAWSDQAAWWLGLLAAVQVVPAGSGGIAAVFAGLIEPLEEVAQAEFERRWSSDIDPSELVIALLDGSPAQQTWHEVARALRGASRFVSQGGSIALCTQQSEGLGKGLRRLNDTHRSREEIEKKLASDAADDALPAAVILQTTRDYHVYFASGLRGDTVESLGMGVLENESQLANLIGQHEVCTLIGSPQHRVVTNP